MNNISVTSINNHQITIYAQYQHSACLQNIKQVKLKLTQMEKVFIKTSLNNEISQQYLYWTWVSSFTGLLTKRRNPEKMVQIVLMVMVITQVVTVMVVEMG